MKKIIVFMFYMGLNAADGALDPSFGNGAGFVNTPLNGFYAFAPAIQTDGKIVVVGSNMEGATITVRYTSDGSLDTTFGVQGVVTDVTGIFASAILVQPNGKILIAGTDAAFLNFQLIRYNSDGSLDSTFGINGVVVGPTGNGTVLALQTDSKIILAGDDNNGLFKVVRYTPNGSIDTIFQSGPGEFANSIAVQNDGKIIVEGNTSIFDLVLVRYNTDGTLDPSFVQTAMPPELWGPMIIQPDGKIIVAGNTFAPNLELARFNTDGSLDTTFGGGVIAGPPGIANSMVLQADGKIVIVGAPTFDGPFFQLVRYTSSGLLDSTFGSGGIVQAPPGITAFGSALQADGKIVAVGSDITFTLFEVARYLNRLAVTPTQIKTVTPTRCNVLLTGTAQNPSNVYIFLNGSLLGGTPTNPNGTNTWSFVAPNNSPNQCAVYSAVALYPDGSLDTAAQNVCVPGDRMWLR